MAELINLNIYTLAEVIVISITIVCCALIFVRYGFNKKGKKVEEKKFTRHIDNPIISPRPGQDWEEYGTFNPAVFQDKDGLVHLLYRAIGNDGVSRVGYASSSDSIHFDQQLSYPVFAMQNPRPTGRPGELYDRKLYPSGGSWYGVEDPRAVEIDGHLYLTFSAFGGWDFVRMGVVSISVADLLAQKWNWTKPKLISPEGEIHKNWVLFPEKIDGKFAIITHVNPEIEILYVDNFRELETGTKRVKKWAPKNKPNETWDTWVRGAGAPPIKTKKGWLLLYHATNHANPHVYRVGALLLDLKDPSKIIGRSGDDFLSAQEWYENDSKPGIVYACGCI
ncbi:MAG: hypothetical protein RL641_346, partial [Candidatus Parcubacteria bacterium]